MLSLFVFIIILSILIVVHEFGHFLVARASGVRVEVFAIGFGPVLFKRKGKDTDFLICAFPLGGYVKLAGESRQECLGKGDEFYNKPVGVKARIIAAGPIFNYILAFVFFWAIAVIGFPEPDYSTTVVGQVLDDYPASSAGVLPDDKVVEVNGKAVSDWTEMKTSISQGRGKINLKLERQGEFISLEIPLEEGEYTDAYGRKKSQQIIGITPVTHELKSGFWGGFLKGGELLFSFTAYIAKGFWLIISGALPFKEAVAGPIGIYYITGEALKIGFGAILHLVAVLNVSLSIINLAPIPLMDGGHIFLLFLEKVRRRRLSEKVEDFIMRLGFVIVGILFVFIFYNDFTKFGSKIWGKNKDVQSIENKQ